MKDFIFEKLFIRKTWKLLTGVKSLHISNNRWREKKLMETLYYITAKINSNGDKSKRRHLATFFFFFSSSPSSSSLISSFESSQLLLWGLSDSRHKFIFISIYCICLHILQFFFYATTFLVITHNFGHLTFPRAIIRLLWAGANTIAHEFLPSKLYLRQQREDEKQRE